MQPTGGAAMQGTLLQLAWAPGVRTADVQALLDAAFGDPALDGDLAELTVAPTQLAPA